jgi:hypothetical protein
MKVPVSQHRRVPDTDGWGGVGFREGLCSDRVLPPISPDGWRITRLQLNLSAEGGKCGK